MKAEIFQASLKDLYSSYNEVIKPLIADIEVRSQKFPLPIFNEIRAYNDHIAQCFWEKVTDEEIEKEIRKAERHIMRIILDCYKYLVVFLNDDVRKFEKQTKNVDLTLINNGTFYLKYRRLYQDAMNQARKAKKLESKNNGLSVEEYELAYNLYNDLEDLIFSINPEVSWARIKFGIKRFGRIILWLFGAIISGVISLFIGCEPFKNYIEGLIT